jgi:hypothetical protein
MTTDHPCQLCGERHPARYQFDAKEHGGAKVTCARCVAGLLAARDAENRELRAEVERLKRGDFTPEEFQNLCHNLHEKPGCTLELQGKGCDAFQKKLFGRAWHSSDATAEETDQWIARLERLEAVTRPIGGEDEC